MQKIKVIYSDGRVSFLERSIINNPGNIPLYWRCFKDSCRTGAIASYYINKQGIAVVNKHFISRFGSLENIV